MRSLFKARWRQLKNVMRRTGKRQYGLFFLLGGGVLFLMGFFFIKVFGFLYYREEFPLFFKLFLSEKILMMAFLTMFMMLIMSALISTLNIFFLSKDLELLLSSPLRSRAVFAWKGIETAVSSALMVIFFSLPVLFAYCYYFAPGIVQIGVVVLVFLLYMLTGVLLGILAGLIVPAFISVKRLQPVLSVVSIILISAIVIFLRMLRPEQFGNPEVVNNLFNYMSGMETGHLSWLPFHWISRALHLVAKKEHWGYIKIIIAFAGIVTILTMFAFFLQHKFYLKLFDKLNKGGGGAYKSGWKPSSLLKMEYGALWKKEIKTFIRTPAQWSQLLIVAAIVIVFILNIKGIPMPHPSVKNLIAYLNLGMAAFVVAGLNSRFSFTTIPMEYPGIIHILASPFSKRKLLRFKFWFYAIPLLITGFALFFAGDLALGLDSFNRISGFFYLMPVLLLLTLLSVYFSLKVDESVPLTPQHLVGSKHGITFMIWSLLYIAAGMVFFLRPTFLYYFHRYISHRVPVWEIALWFTAFWLIHLLAAIIIYKRSIALWQKKEI